MRNFEEFKNSYIKERESHIKNNLHTVFGMWFRIIDSNNYWVKFHEREIAIARYGIGWLENLINTNRITVSELIEFHLSLKNSNSKLIERSNFILVVISAISVLGLTKLNIVFEKIFNEPPMVFLIFVVLLIIGTLIERINVLRKVALNEELANVIEKKI